MQEIHHRIMLIRGVIAGREVDGHIPCCWISQQIPLQRWAVDGIGNKRSDRAGRLRWSSKLLNEPQLIKAHPMFDDFAVSYAIDNIPHRCHISASWRDAYHIPLVCATKCCSDHDLICFSNHEISYQFVARKSRLEHCNVLLQRLIGIGDIFVHRCRGFVLATECIKVTGDKRLVFLWITRVASYIGRFRPGIIFAPHRIHNAKLLQHAQGVLDYPTFSEHPVGDAIDADSRDCSMHTSGRNAHILIFMCADSCPTVDDHIPFGDEIVNSHMEVGEGSTERDVALFVYFGAGNRGRARTVGNEVIGEHFVYHVQVSFVKRLVIKTSDECFVCLCVGGCLKNSTY